MDGKNNRGVVLGTTVRSGDLVAHFVSLPDMTLTREALPFRLDFDSIGSVAKNQMLVAGVLIFKVPARVHRAEKRRLPFKRWLCFVPSQLDDTYISRLSLVRDDHEEIKGCEPNQNRTNRW